MLGLQPPAPTAAAPATRSSSSALRAMPSRAWWRATACGFAAAGLEPTTPARTSESHALIALTWPEMQHPKASHPPPSPPCFLHQQVSHPSVDEFTEIAANAFTVRISHLQHLALASFWRSGPSTA
jgi:hypothetical protein